MNPKSAKSKISWLAWAGVLVWALALAAGFGFAMQQDFNAGARAEAPLDWPTQSRLHRETGKPAAVLFLHPNCPCSTATLAEFERIQARVNRPATLLVVLVWPTAGEHEPTALARMAGRISGMTLVNDDGSEARLFGAKTSGQMLVYDAKGALQFNGGITASRGHEGANDGEASATASLCGETDEPICCDVFGCSLFHDRNENERP